MNKKLDMKVLIGIAVIAIGFILFLDNMGFHFGVNLFDFWPVIFIIIGLNHLSQTSGRNRSLSGYIFIIIGGLLLANNLDIIYLNFSDLLPLVLILIGLNILYKHVFQKNVPEAGATGAADFIDLTFLLGGGEHRFTTKTLKGGDVTAIMGGGTINLRDAGSDLDEIIIDVFAFWGGIEIIVPYHWHVNIQGNPILGGMENNTHYPEENELMDTGKRPMTLVIRGSAIMGGVEVKN